MSVAGACSCGSTWRWRRVDDPMRIGDWLCWACEPPGPGNVVDVCDVRGRPRVLFALPAAMLDANLFITELQAHGALVAMQLEPPVARWR